MKTVFAITGKHIRDSIRNIPSLMILIIYPAVAFIMITAMQGEENLDGFFVPMFAAMHGSFAPLVLSSNILAEEKEKGTLRSLIMAGAGRGEYLVSLSLFVVTASLLTGSVFLLMKPFSAAEALEFAAAMLMGTVISTLIGLCVGICSKSVTASNGMAVPVGLVFALLPMLGQFNGTIAKAAKFTYSGQLRNVLAGGGFTSSALLVAAAYFGGLCGLLVFLFHRKGME